MKAKFVNRFALKSLAATGAMAAFALGAAAVRADVREKTSEKEALTVEIDERGLVRVGFAGQSFESANTIPATVKSREIGRVEMELTTADGPVRAVWEKSASSPRTLDLYLSAPKGRPMRAALDYPGGWATRAGDDLILPFGEGVAYPVTDPFVRFTRARYPFSYGMAAAMGFFGVARGTAFAMTGVDGQLNAAIVCETNAPYRAGASWSPVDGTWGEDRHLRFFFGRSLGEVAAAYRAWRESQGAVRTLADKAKTNPHVADFERRDLEPAQGRSREVLSSRDSERAADDVQPHVGIRMADGRPPCPAHDLRERPRGNG